MNDYVELTEKSTPGAETLAATANEIPALEGLLRRLKEQRRELVHHRYTLAQAVLDLGDKVLAAAETEDHAELTESYRKVATTFLPYAREIVVAGAVAWDRPEVREAARIVVINPGV